MSCFQDRVSDEHSSPSRAGPSLVAHVSMSHVGLISPCSRGWSAYHIHGSTSHTSLPFALPYHCFHSGRSFPLPLYTHRSPIPPHGDKDTAQTPQHPLDSINYHAQQQCFPSHISVLQLSSGAATAP